MVALGLVPVKKSKKATSCLPYLLEETAVEGMAAGGRSGTLTESGPLTPGLPSVATMCLKLKLAISIFAPVPLNRNRKV
jgi:hypothetical protein